MKQKPTKQPKQKSMVMRIAVLCIVGAMLLGFILMPLLQGLV